MTNSQENIALDGILKDGRHCLQARIYYADTDFSGVVYHARYLEFLERGRSEFLRASGIHHTQLAQGETGEKLAWIVRRMEIEFKKPARIDDLVTIITSITAISGARVSMQQAIFCNDVELVVARVEAAIINEEGRPRRFPKSFQLAH